MAEEAPRKAYQFYGRRIGRRLRELQRKILTESLQAVQIEAEKSIVLPVLFPENCQHYILEIGAGDGGHVCYQAENNPDIGFIAVEPYLNGAAKLIATLTEKKLQNIRVYTGDVRDLWSLLPLQQFAAVYMLFPDPWPKKRHESRRLAQRQTLENISGLLKAGGTFYFASDWAPYISHVLEEVQQVPSLQWQAQSQADWQTSFYAPYITKYQAKALREGREPAFLTFLKIE